MNRYLIISVVFVLLATGCQKRVVSSDTANLPKSEVERAKIYIDRDICKNCYRYFVNGTVEVNDKFRKYFQSKLNNWNASIFNEFYAVVDSSSRANLVIKLAGIDHDYDSDQNQWSHNLKLRFVVQNANQPTETRISEAVETKDVDLITAIGTAFKLFETALAKNIGLQNQSSGQGAVYITRAKINFECVSSNYGGVEMIAVNIENNLGFYSAPTFARSGSDCDEIAKRLTKKHGRVLLRSRFRGPIPPQLVRICRFNLPGQRMYPLQNYLIYPEGKVEAQRIVKEFYTMADCLRRM